MELIDLLYRSDYKALSHEEAGKVVGGTYVFDKLKLPTVHQVYTVTETKQHLVVVRLKRDGAIVFAELLEPGKMKAAGKIDTPFTINQIGLPPEPLPHAVIPPDGPAIVMGAKLRKLEDLQMDVIDWFYSFVGKHIPEGIKDTYVATWHTQQWRKSANSYTLAPGQKKNVLIEQKSGITRVNTASTTLTGSASASAGGALDGFSASISAAMSYSETNSHSLTLQASSTNTIEDSVENPDPKKSLTIIHWELVDTFTSVAGKVPVGINFEEERKIFQIEHVQTPTLVRTYKS
jgi:hypothetical protein